MQQYGIATAVIGKDPAQAELVCNTVSLHNGDPKTRELLAEHSFRTPVDLTDSQAIRHAFKKLLAVTAGVVALQMAAADLAERECPKIPMIVGKDSRASYDLDLIFSALIPDLDNSNSFTAEEKKYHLQVATVLNRLFLDSGNFTPSQIIKDTQLTKARKLLESGKNELNEMLKPYMQKHADCQSLGIRDDTYYLLLELAEQRGAAFALACNLAYNRMGIPQVTSNLYFIHENALWKDFPKNPERQTKYPVYTYYSAHPDFLDATRKEYQAAVGIEREVYLKPADEKASPFFVDVITAMLIEQAKTESGFKLEIPQFDRATLRDYFNRSENGSAHWKAELFEQQGYIQFNDYWGEILRRSYNVAAFGTS